MSNKKQLPEITAAEASKISVSALAVRPNDASRFGQGGLSAKGLQEWFDKLPNLVKEKFNEIAKTLASDEAAKYIGMNALGVDNLHDFIALFGERGTGMNDKNISDYIQALYTHEGDTEPESISLQLIVSNIVERIVQAKAAQEVLDELIRTATLSVRPGNVINLNFDTGDVTVDTSAQLKPVSTAGIEDGAVTTAKILNSAVTTEKLSSGVRRTINSAFNEVEYDAENGVLKFNSADDSTEIDLPLELIVSHGYFDERTGDIVLVLANGEEIRIPLDDFVNRVTSDIAELKEKLNASFMDVRLSDDQKLIFTLQDNSEKEISLPDSNAGGSSAKLYRHDIHFTEYWLGIDDIWITIYNTDPTNYSKKAVFTEYDENGDWIYEYTEPLTEENYSFLPPNAEIVATGTIDGSGAGEARCVLTAIKYIPETGIELYGIDLTDGFHINAGHFAEYPFGRIGEIIDSVTEISGELENGDVVRY